MIFLASQENIKRIHLGTTTKKERGKERKREKERMKDKKKSKDIVSKNMSEENRFPSLPVF